MTIELTGTSDCDGMIAAQLVHGTLLSEIFLKVVLPIDIYRALIYLDPELLYMHQAAIATWYL